MGTSVLHLHGICYPKSLSTKKVLGHHQRKRFSPQHLQKSNNLQIQFYGAFKIIEYIFKNEESFGQERNKTTSVESS